MKTYCWSNQNRLSSHLRIATAVWALALVSGVILITPTIATGTFNLDGQIDNNAGTFSLPWHGTISTVGATKH